MSSNHRIGDSFTRSNPGRLQDAIQRLTFTRNLGGFNTLAAEFNRQHPAKKAGA